MHNPKSTLLDTRIISIFLMALSSIWLLRDSVYPHVCGGTQTGCGRECQFDGLSPRVRGNLLVIHVAPIGGRSIPACAGEPKCLNRFALPIAVYPRVCGGTLVGGVVIRDDVGLSPRVRGNPGVIAPGITNLRSIPACAGEPWAMDIGVVIGRVYPRVCGGTYGRPRRAMGSVGLSPRVRGNRVKTNRTGLAWRSIPACAGEPCCLSSEGTLPVYPRVCGGTQPQTYSQAPPAGLSPRVRGNLIQLSLREPILGSIPACAGEPPCPESSLRTGRVYPRVCGGTRSHGRATERLRGLSPRVRGNRNSPIWLQAQHRSIPACAGEP